MNIAIIGRSKMLYNVMLYMHEEGYKIDLIVTSKEAPEYDVTSIDFENFAKKIGAQFIYTPKINEKKIMDQLQSIPQMDLAISINYTGVISQEVIDLFKIGVLNMHAGDLPKYRGNAVVAWAMLNGEKEVVNCVHKMIGGELDSGQILAKDHFPININTKISEVFNWLDNNAPAIFKVALDNLKKDPDYVLEVQSTDPKDALRCYPRKPEDGKIYWNQSNENILKLINASSEPFSGAFATYKGNLITLWRAKIIDDEEKWVGIPGQITAINSEGVTVLTGKGKLTITEVEYQGERINPNKLINSLRDRLY